MPLGSHDHLSTLSFILKMFDVNRCSKRELGCELQEPRRRSLYYLAEQGVRNITIDSRWPEELRMIEDIERLHPQLKCLSFGYTDRFQQRKVGVEHPWPRKISP